MLDDLLIWLIMLALGVFLAVAFLSALVTAEAVLSAWREGRMLEAVLHFAVLTAIFMLLACGALLLLAEAETYGELC